MDPFSIRTDRWASRRSRRTGQSCRDLTPAGPRWPAQVIISTKNGGTNHLDDHASIALWPTLNSFVITYPRHDLWPHLGISAWPDEKSKVLQTYPAFAGIFDQVHITHGYCVEEGPD